MIPVPVMSIALKVTAVVNILAAVAALTAPALNVQLLFGVDHLDPFLLRYHYIIWMFVGSMGIGYAIASQNPAKQTGLVAAAGLGKLGFGLLLVEMLARGLGTWLLVLPILFDGILGIVFLSFVSQRLRSPG